MHAVIGGAGEVGYAVARSLYKDGYTVALIDSHPHAADHAESLDAQVVRGNAASPAALADAGLGKASVFIGVTSADEVNILGAAQAKVKGCRTIARVNGADYLNEPVSLTVFRNIGLDVAISPDLVTATRISRILTTPTLLDTEVISGGKVHILQSKVNRGAPAVNRPLKDLDIPGSAILVSLFRNGDVQIPHGDTVFKVGDEVVAIITDIGSIQKIGTLLGYHPHVLTDKTAEKIMIFGATRTGIHLSSLLQNSARVVLIEPDEERCQKASSALTSTLVIQGTGTDREILAEEGIEEVDAFVAASDREGLNVLSCLLAKQLGAKTTISLVDRLELKGTLHETGVDTVISPRMATVSAILRHVKERLSLSVLHYGEARVIEVLLKEGNPVAGKRLKDLSMPKNSIIAAIARGDDVVVPHGDTKLTAGDRLVIYAKTEEIRKLDRLLHMEQGAG